MNRLAVRHRRQRGAETLHDHFDRIRGKVEGRREETAQEASPGTGVIRTEVKMLNVDI
jgi:hypothetical protein